MKNVSKSVYMQYLKCPKMMWYNLHGFERVISETTQRTLDNGIEFGIMAQKYFGDFVVVSPDKDESMVEQTLNHLKNLYLKETTNYVKK